ncbi:hypothetical protein JCM3774_001948 [Rhodotorula dairenensis]
MGVKGDPDNSDVKPSVDASKHTLTIRLGSDQDELTIKVKGTTKFAKIYHAVAQQTGKEKGTFILTRDGQRVNEVETPADLDFEEEELLDLHLAQVGGGGGSATRRP